MESKGPTKRIIIALSGISAAQYCVSLRLIESIDSIGHRRHSAEWPGS